MALPRNVRTSGNDHIPTRSQMYGPFIDTNGNVYVLGAYLNGTTTTVEVSKAGNEGDAAFSVVDTSTITNGGTPQTLDGWQDGDQIYIAIQAVTNLARHYAIFNTSDHTTPDQFSTDLSQIETVTTPTTEETTIVTRSDGDILVASGGDSEKIKGTNYYRTVWHRHEGSGWTTTQMPNQTAVEADFRGCAIAIEDATTDRAHIAWQDYTNDKLYHASISSANSVSGREEVGTDRAPGNRNNPVHKGVHYDNGTVERVTMGFIDWDIRPATFEVDDDGSPSSPEQVEATVVYNRGNINLVADLVLAVDPANDTAYAVYIENTSRDIFFESNVDSAGWGSKTTLRTGTYQFVSANVWEKADGSIVLAYCYGSGTALYFDEYELVGVSAPVFPRRQLTTVRM